MGCASEPADWYGDSAFTESERTEIQRGADWLYAQTGRPSPRIAWDYRPGAEPMPKTIRRGAHGATTGFCTHGGGAVYLDPSSPTLAGLAAHELAHCAFGLEDDGGTDGIMRVLEPMRWTEREQAQCALSDACAL